MLAHSGDNRECFVLVINYFVSANPIRRHEIDYCVNANLKVDQIKSVISIGEDIPFSDPKLKIIKSAKRPTYQDMVDFCNDNLSGELCILSNIDIVFDDSLDLIHKIDMHNKLLCLTRWEHDLVGNWAANCLRKKQAGAGTQDSWIFRAPLPVYDADFTMGQMCCDNKFALLAKKAGLECYNPCYDVICKHWHDSDHRTYDPKVRLDGYLAVMPCKLRDIS